MNSLHVELVGAYEHLYNMLIDQPRTSLRIYFDHGSMTWIFKEINMLYNNSCAIISVYVTLTVPIEFTLGRLQYQ